MKFRNLSEILSVLTNAELEELERLITIQRMKLFFRGEEE